MVYVFVETGGPVVGMSISIKLVLPKSVGDLEMMPVNLLVSMVFSLHCISNVTFASCTCIGDLLLSCACVWKLELSGNTGSRGFEGWDLSCALSLWCCSEHMFWTYSALSTLVMEPNLNFMCTSPMGPRLLPSEETTFLLVGNNLTCCCMEL